MSMQSLTARLGIAFMLLIGMTHCFAESLIVIPGSKLTIKMPTNDWQVLVTDEPAERVVFLVNPAKRATLLALVRVMTIPVPKEGPFNPDLDACWKSVLRMLRGTSTEAAIRLNGATDGCATSQPMNKTTRNWIERDDPEMAALLASRGLRFGPDVVSFRVSEPMMLDKRLAVVGFLDASVELQIESPTPNEKKTKLKLQDWTTLLGNAIADSIQKRDSLVVWPQLSFANVP